MKQNVETKCRKIATVKYFQYYRKMKCTAALSTNKGKNLSKATQMFIFPAW